MSQRERLGRGFAFPVAPSPDGQLAWRAGPEKIEESIRIILETSPGERVMRPAFGCGLRRFLMQPNTSATRSQIAREVERSLVEHEPRINVTQVRVLPDEDPALVLVHIAYVVSRTSRPQNLVYPFYLQD